MWMKYVINYRGKILFISMAVGQALSKLVHSHNNTDLDFMALFLKISKNGGSAVSLGSLF